LLRLRPCFFDFCCCARCLAVFMIDES
jgi:hypothetical protein